MNRWNSSMTRVVSAPPAATGADGSAVVAVEPAADSNGVVVAGTARGTAAGTAATGIAGTTAPGAGCDAGAAARMAKAGAGGVEGAGAGARGAGLSGRAWPPSTIQVAGDSGLSRVSATSVA